jgi:hypothetical protein
MDAQVTAPAKRLARWCYERGLDERILGAGEQLLGRAVTQALGRRATPQLEHALWQHVEVLLRQRRHLGHHPWHRPARGGDMSVVRDRRAGLSPTRSRPMPGVLQAHAPQHSQGGLRQPSVLRRNCRAGHPP